MGLEDHDWYRDEIRRRERPEPAMLAGINQQLRHAAWQRAPRIAGVVVAIVIAAMVVLVIMTPVCDRDGWLASPGGCWDASRQALTDQVSGNMEATRGYPVMVVRVDR